MPKHRLAPLALMTIACVQTGGAPGFAQPLADNSFLLEEAYNQEAGVVQHISFWRRGREGAGDGLWTYTFTQEWPAPSQRHQLGFTLPLLESPLDGDTEVGDLLLNYRYQWIAGERIAAAPRLSLLLPTGEPEQGTGSGAAGLQANFPLSIELGRRWVGHSNLGATWIPDAESAAGAAADTLAWNLGQSVIYRALPRLDLLAEAVWARTEEAVGPGRVERGGEGLLAAGLRWAHDFDNGLQIVPGVAYAVGFDDADGEESVLFYLSFEHPFRR